MFGTVKKMQCFHFLIIKYLRIRTIIEGTVVPLGWRMSIISQWEWISLAKQAFALCQKLNPCSLQMWQDLNSSWDRSLCFSDSSLTSCIYSPWECTDLMRSPHPTRWYRFEDPQLSLPKRQFLRTDRNKEKRSLLVKQELTKTLFSQYLGMVYLGLFVGWKYLKIENFVLHSSLNYHWLRNWMKWTLPSQLDYEKTR